VIHTSRRNCAGLWIDERQCGVVRASLISELWGDKLVFKAGDANLRIKECIISRIAPPHENAHSLNASRPPPPAPLPMREGRNPNRETKKKRPPGYLEGRGLCHFRSRIQI